MSDQYYGANADAKLYIGTSTAVPLPAPGSDSFTEVPLLGTITPPPKEQSAASFYILNDKNPRAVGGRSQDKTVEFNLVIDHSEAVHVLISADADVAGGRKRNWRITYPDGYQLDFKGFVTKWTESALDASADATPHRADSTIRVDGAVTETP